MITQGSYQLARFAVDADREWQRLDAQVDLFWENELALYEQLGLRDGLCVLDCGCGPGGLLERLHTRFPSLRSTGVEVDPTLAAIARERLNRSAPGRTRILVQSITELDLPEHTFDFVLCRLVLEHVPQVAGALREIRRVLKPGGIALIIDNDFDFHERAWPEVRALPGLYGAYSRARARDGGNPRIGRELPGLLKRGGLEAVQFHALVAHNELTGDEAFFRAEGSGIPTQLVRNGYLKADFLDSVAEQWQAMVETPGHAIMRILFAASGRKPASNGSAAVELKAAEAPRHGAARPQDEPAPDRLETPEAIGRFMQAVLSAVMEIPVEMLPLNAPLVQCEVDSLAALRLCNRLRERVGVTIRITDVLGGCSISDLAGEVFANLQSTAATADRVDPTLLATTPVPVTITRQAR